MYQNKLKTSGRMKRYIKSFEALRLKAYLDSAGVWTIGWGTTVYPNGVKVLRWDICTKQQAQEYFDFDISNFEEVINQSVNRYINQNQFDALMSFVYNLGETKFRNSTLLKLLNQGNYNGASKQLPRWNKYRNPKTGKLEPLRGLTIRRKKEKEIFDTLLEFKLTKNIISYFDNLKAKSYSFYYRNRPFNFKLIKIEAA